MDFSIPEFIASPIDEGFGPEDAGTKELYREVEAFARHGQPILIFGPTGAGKEFLARHYYNTLVKAEFYGQYKDGWPLRFKEIKESYSKYYSEKELDIFVRSIRPGVFQSINSATIYPNLAESILFGHEANAFTDALTRPGLLESIKYGVLFLDEVGDLPKELQAKMLRAVDSEICEGRRMGGKMDYSLKDLIIIAATNRPRKKIRDDFYYKIGIEVEIKGIDERPKDTVKSIPHFIAKAIGKRKDYSSVTRMFGLTISDIRSVNKLSEAEEVKNFAKSLSDSIAEEILERRWPGNFRALRRAIESSVMRIESIKDPALFSKEFQKHFSWYVSKYSEGAFKTAGVEKTFPGEVIFPSPNPELDMRIEEELNKHNLKGIDDHEKKILSVFFSRTHERGFVRQELEKFYSKSGSIRFVSPTHVRGRINLLIDLDILCVKGKGKSTRYEIGKEFLRIVRSKAGEIFSLPEVSKRLEGRSIEIKSLAENLNKNDRIYIEAPPGYGKTFFIAVFCKEMKDKYSFFYYPLGEGGINKMFRGYNWIIAK